MPESMQLPLFRQLLERLPLPDRLVVLDIIDYFRFENKEPAVDKATVTGRLFLKSIDSCLIRNSQSTETPRGLNRCQSRPALVTAMKLDQLSDVNVGDPITISKTEGFSADKILYPLDAAAGHCLVTSIHESDLPWFRMALVRLHAVPGHVKGDIRSMQKIIGKEFFDNETLVATADDEFVQTIGRIAFENVPENRSTADFDHWLWSD